VRGEGPYWVSLYNQQHTVSVSGISIVGAFEAVISLAPGSLSLSRVVLRGNHFASSGGPVTVSRSTLSSNSAGSSPAARPHRFPQHPERQQRGQRRSDRYRGPVSISQSTLSGNTVVPSQETGAVVLSRRETTLQSTIIANNSGANCGVAGHWPGPLTSLGHNLADDDSCNLTAEGDQPNTDPFLRPLGNYGGPTDTFALRPTSPAVDAGFAGNATTDQRGLPRIVNYSGVPMAVGGDNSDIGAFELQSP
jgi:hypothetical protein